MGEEKIVERRKEMGTTAEGTGLGKWVRRGMGVGREEGPDGKG